MQVARAGPIHPAGQPVKPAGRFDPSSGASFEQVLTQEIQKDRTPSAEGREPAPAERDADSQPEEKTSAADAAAIPVATLVTPPAKPVEPPPGEVKVAPGTAGTSDTGAASAVIAGIGSVAAGVPGATCPGQRRRPTCPAVPLSGVPARIVLPPADSAQATPPQAQKTAARADTFQAALETARMFTGVPITVQCQPETPGPPAQPERPAGAGAGPAGAAPEQCQRGPDGGSGPGSQSTG